MHMKCVKWMLDHIVQGLASHMAELIAPCCQVALNYEVHPVDPKQTVCTVQLNLTCHAVSL